MKRAKLALWARVDGKMVDVSQWSQQRLMLHVRTLIRRAKARLESGKASDIFDAFGDDENRENDGIPGLTMPSLVAASGKSPERFLGWCRRTNKRQTLLMFERALAHT